MEDWIKTIGVAILASLGTILGFHPRLKRVEKDIKDKLDKEVFEEVRKHIDTRFDSQNHWVESIDNKLEALKNKK